MTQPIIERRRIEAEILAHVLATLTDRLGAAEAQAVVGEAVSRAAVAHGRNAAEALGRAPDLADFAAILPAWTADGALEIEVLDAAPGRLSFDVTRCRYAEMYRAMGLGAVGHLLSCNRDADFCTGYNPAIRLERRTTIMSGADRCDFRYELDDVSADRASTDTRE